MNKEQYVRKLFDTIPTRYDLFNRIASMGMDRSWRRKTIDSLQLQPGMKVLDLATGTGDLAIESALRMLPLGLVAGCDPSRGMLVSGARRHFLGSGDGAASVAGWHIRLAQGKGEQLPFSEAAFHAATIGFALRNVSDMPAVFKELRRVLRSGGRLALLEFGRPRNPLVRAGHWLWLTLVIPPLGLLTTGKLWPFLYLRRSILGFLSPEQVVALLQSAGFREVKADPLFFGSVTLYQAQA